MDFKFPNFGKKPAEKHELTEEELAERKARARFKKALKETVSSLIVIAAAAVLLSTIFFPVLQINGKSMEPILKNNDIVLMEKTTNFSPGQIVCFQWNNKTLLKRVIGVPGDWIDINKEGDVFVNGKKLNEPYVKEKGLGETDMDFPVQVPENCYFVLGDNRESSIDSRSSVIGFVNKDQIIGKVLMRIWPLNEITFF
ncbi:MAG: signal peptidase I [Erysipelotrichaceae bacterium]|nr:signal peptidase I [Erysipelotrichaceae bacterium]